MGSKSIDIENLKLLIPKLWEKDWDDVIDDADEEKALLIFQKRAASLLRGISDDQANWARIAWLSLWTKCFASLEGAIAAQAAKSIHVMRMLARSSFEQWLHVQIISLPMIEYYEQRINDAVELIKRKEDVKKRLEAYVAWCIWNDKLGRENIATEENLKAIWDPNPAREILEKEGGLEAHQALFGPFDIEVDERKLDKGMLSQRTDLTDVHPAKLI